MQCTLPNSTTLSNSISIEDLNFRSIKNLKKVPVGASATFQGSQLIEPIVQPSYYSSKAHVIQQTTIKEFKLPPSINKNSSNNPTSY